MLKEEGVEDDEAAKTVGEIIVKIKKILGVSKGSGVVWLSKKKGELESWVTIGKEGVYLIERGGWASLITSAIPREVKILKILPEDWHLQKELFYSVKFEVKGKPVRIVGALDEVAKGLKQISILRNPEALKCLLEEMAEEVEETWYAVGPWLVDGELKLVTETGYRLLWRTVTKWEPEHGGDVKLGLEVTNGFIRSYRNPEVPAIALCYYPALGLAYEVRKELGYLPHLVIEGKRGGGKSIIAEFMALLNNAEPGSGLPKMVYETQKLLAQSKLILILDEAHNMSEDALNELRRAATNIHLADKPGPNIQGVYLNLRGVVMTANEGLRIGLDSEDKFLRLYLSAEYGIDVEKARGFAPNSMDLEKIKAVKAVGMEVLNEIRQDIRGEEGGA